MNNYMKKRRRSNNDYNKEFWKIRKKKDYNNINLNNNNNDIIEIPGFYFDIEKNRYFPLENKNNGILKSYSQIIDEKNRRNHNQKINKNNKYQISNFQIIRFQKFYDNSYINKNINKEEIISKNYEIISFGEKLDDLPYKIFHDKYLIKMQFNINYTSLLINKIDDENYYKKFFIYEKFDNCKIIGNSIFLIQNYINIFCLSNFLDLLNSKKEKLQISITKCFSFKIHNFKSLPMMYDWPIITFYHDIYYYLIKNHLFSFEIENKEFITKNTDSIIIEKNVFLSKIIFKGKHIFQNHYFFTNLIVSLKYFTLFNKDGKILFINKNNYQIEYILNTLNTTIIEVLKIKKNLYLLQNSIHSIFLFDKYNKKIIELYVSNKTNNLTFNQKLISFQNKINLIFFKNEYNEVIIYSLLEKKIIKVLQQNNLNENKIRFLIDNYENKFIIPI